MLGKEPFPSFEETLPYVSSEDDHRAVVMKPISQESSVLKTVQESVNSAAIVQTKPGTKKKKKNWRKHTRWCAYCNKPRHTREMCWKPHEKLSSHGNKGGRQPCKERVTIEDLNL